MAELHLDSEYKDRWIIFHLANGAVEDSRLKNWRQVAWDQVVCLSAHLVGHIHSVDCGYPGFCAFMNYRWAGREATFDSEGQYAGHRPIKIWTIGWTDGEDCFLKDIDFYTGQMIKEYREPLNQNSGHIHPLVKGKIMDRKVKHGLQKFS